MKEPGMDLKAQIRAFITKNFYIPDGSALPDEASLLDRGIIDSTGVFEVIGFIEDTFRLTVEDAEMVPENLDSIDRITSYIERKRTSPA
jgi:acyl carrier protein